MALAVLIFSEGFGSNTEKSLCRAAAVRMGQMFAAGLILMMECADNLLDYSLNFPAEFWARVRPQWGQCLFENRRS